MKSKQKMEPIAIIVAVDEDGGFGKDGGIPWVDEDWAREDFKHFQRTTKEHVCIMGRKTYEDMLAIRKDRAKDKEAAIDEILPNRESFVLTRNFEYVAEGATTARALREAVQKTTEDDERTIFVLGGEKLFIESLVWADTIYMTIMKGRFGCDKFFNTKYVLQHFNITEATEHEHMTFVKYTRK